MKFNKSEERFIYHWSRFESWKRDSMPYVWSHDKRGFNAIKKLAEAGIAIILEEKEVAIGKKGEKVIRITYRVDCEKLKEALNGD